MKFLSYDGILAQIVRYIWKLFLLNTCFVICCLPVVTIGASITAMYAVLLHVGDEAGVIGRYFRAFRENFRQAGVIWLVFGGIFLILGTDWYFLLTYQFPGSDLLQIITVLLTVAYLCVGSYVFPLQAHYDNPPAITMKNAVLLSLSRLFSGLLMGFVTVFPLVLFLLDLDLFINLAALWLPVGFALQMQINSLIVKRVFRKLEERRSDG